MHFTKWYQCQHTAWILPHSPSLHLMGKHTFNSMKSLDCLELKNSFLNENELLASSRSHSLPFSEPRVACGGWGVGWEDVSCATIGLSNLRSSSNGLYFLSCDISNSIFLLNRTRIFILRGILRERMDVVRKDNDPAGDRPPCMHPPIHPLLSLLDLPH